MLKHGNHAKTAVKAKRLSHSGFLNTQLAHTSRRFLGPFSSAATLLAIFLWTAVLLAGSSSYIIVVTLTLRTLDMSALSSETVMSCGISGWLGGDEATCLDDEGCCRAVWRAVYGVVTSSWE